MVMNLMSFSAPFYSGWVFDRTGSYQWVVLPAAVLLGVAGVLNWLLPEARRSISGPVDSSPAGS